MTSPRILKAPLPRTLAVAMVLPPVLLGVMALLDHSRTRALVGWTTLALAVLAAVTLLWSTRRAVVLEDDALTTRWIRRRRIARSEVEGVEPSSAVSGGALVIVHSGGQRTALNLVASRPDIERMRQEVLAWSGAPDRPVVPLREGSEELSWQVPVPTQATVSMGIAGVILALVPVSLLWHDVPWWGWCAAALLAASLAPLLPALRGVQVRIEGSELVVRGRREARLRAADVVRVVTVSSQDQRRSLLDLVGRHPVQLPTGDRLDERSAAVQRWAEEHGGGAGSPEPFQEPRRWTDLLRQLVLMLSAMTSFGAAMTRPDSVLGAAIFPVMVAVWTFFQPTTVVRDWSDRA